MRWVLRIAFVVAVLPACDVTIGRPLSRDSVIVRDLQVPQRKPWREGKHRKNRDRFERTQAR